MLALLLFAQSICQPCYSLLSLYVSLAIVYSVKLSTLLLFTQSIYLPFYCFFSQNVSLANVY